MLGFVLIFTAVSHGETSPLQKFTVQQAASRNAVCNDGSPAVYYFRPGTGSGSNDWVLFLGGGGFCHSVESCNRRKQSSPELMTSLDKPSTLKGSGIFSDSADRNPDFYNFNHVVVPYCSSDLWSGNREANASTGGHEFRGQKIFRSIVSDLQQMGGSRNLSSAQRVLLSGTSAGGIGVMVHLDWLATQLQNAEVKGLNDAGWTPDLPSFLPIPNLNGPVQQALQLWNGKSDRTCENSITGSKYRCYTSAVYPFISTPLMVQMSQYDSVYLGGIGVHQPFDAAETFLANLFAGAIRDSLEPVNAAFSPRTNTHGVLPYKRFRALRVNGLSLQQILGNWFFERPGPVKIVKD